jgi:ABC-type uncharacterized transport system substrate-binding protein
MERMVKLGVLVVMLLGLLINVTGAAEMKTVVLTEFPVEPTRTYMRQQILAGLAQAGFEENQNVKIVSLVPAEVADWPEQVTQLAPDVVIDFSGSTGAAPKLYEMGVPTVSYWGTDPYVDADGMPTGIITGVYTAHKDTVYNSLKLLQLAAPLKEGQKAVFFENKRTVVFPTSEVLEALERLNVPLKAIENTSVYEDWQAALLKYNDDPEVGWLVVLAWPFVKRDGSVPNRAVELAQWQRERLKKPYVTYWEITVMTGVLCGYAVDSNDAALQIGEMAARVLQGEAIQNIKAEYPRKTVIALNRKVADFMGITFSMDALRAANVIFDDYEGKDVIRK